MLFIKERKKYQQMMHAPQRAQLKKNSGENESFWKRNSDLDEIQIWRGKKSMAQSFWDPTSKISLHVHDEQKQK